MVSQASQADFFGSAPEARKYRVLEIIGKGSYGVVASAIDQQTNQKVAIKKIINVFEHVSDSTRILREIKLLRLLKHPGATQPLPPTLHHTPHLPLTGLSVLCGSRAPCIATQHSQFSCCQLRPAQPHCTLHVPQTSSRSSTSCFPRTRSASRTSLSSLSSWRPTSTRHAPCPPALHNTTYARSRRLVQRVQRRDAASRSITTRDTHRDTPGVSPPGSHPSTHVHRRLCNPRAVRRAVRSC